MSHTPSSHGGDLFQGFTGHTPAPGGGAGAGGGGMSGGDEATIDLSKYFAALRRRWPLLLLCCLVASAYTLIHFSLSEKLYKASTTIQIERKRLSLLALGQAGWLEDWWNLEYYPTQYRLLRSRGMAERVVRNLRLQEDPSFNPKANTLLPGENPNQNLDASKQLAGLAARVQSGLTVQPIKDTQLVELSYVSNSPDLAARIANGYAEVFIEWGIENRTSTVGRASSFLSAQIENLRSQIEERQTQLNNFASEGDNSLDPAGEALSERSKILNSQYNQVVAQVISLQAAYNELRNQPKDSVVNASSGQIATLNAEIFELESEYNSKLLTYTPEWPEMVRLKESIGEKKALVERTVNDVYEKELDLARASLQTAQREKASLERELAQLSDEARLQNPETLEYINQNTYIETRKELLAELVKRQSETEVASRVQTSQESNVRIVDRAVVPGAAFKPSLETDLSRALILGLMIGVGIVLLLEYLDRTVKSPEELEALLRQPTLAVIPDIAQERGRGGLRLRGGRGAYNYNYGYGYGYGYGNSSRKDSAGAAGDLEKSIELLPHHSPRLAVSEAYRSLRTALLLSTAEELKVVALTSAEPGEGKTATTTNLGVVMAQLGRRVLIIDGDLRRPRLHKIFKASNRAGLVNYLTSNVDLESLVIETPVPNLVVMPSGPIPPNPSELLASDRMRDLIKMLRTRFDFVLLDTPPVLPVADAVILGTMADGVVLCARAGVLLREDAKYTRERLSYSEMKIIGAVLNRYSTGSSSYNKKYRYYGVYEDPGAAANTNVA
ncbi:MAG: polysaccharide biosynthesis tyrosine autokinase [Acidobacteriota bacterium]